MDVGSRRGRASTSRGSWQTPSIGGSKGDDPHAKRTGREGGGVGQLVEEGAGIITEQRI